MEKPVRVGVIGAGYWGPNLIRNFYEIDQADLQIVCDLRQERLDHIQSRYPGVRVCQDYHEVLNSGLDAVVIATPVSTHYPLAMECLRAGLHVMVEKPLASSSLEAAEMVRTADQMGLVLMTGHIFIYNPAISALKEIIASGEIGRVYYINCTRVNLGLYQPDVNVVWDLAPHDISILQHILGAHPEAASARGGMFVKPGVYDVAYLTLYFPGSVMADLRVSWLDPCKIRRITIVGSKKMIIYDDIEPVEKIKICDKGVDVQPYTDTFEEFHLAYRYGKEVAYPLQWVEPLRAECLHFLECVRTGCLPLTNGHEGLSVVRVLEAAQRSLTNNNTKEKVEWEAAWNTVA
jgi:predicted dehydrogenase